MIPEQVKQIAGERTVKETPYPGYYVTDNGVVISVFVHGSRARRIDFDHAHIVKAQQMKNGYHAVSMLRDGRSKTTYIHQIVLESFVGPRPPNCEACHQNGKRADNRIENLRWDTTQANHVDSVNHGTFSKPPRTNMRGEQNGNARFTEADIKQIRKLRSEGMAQKDIGALFGVGQTTISDITRRRSWAWVE